MKHRYIFIGLFVTFGIIATAGFVVSLKALQMAKTRPVSLERICLQSHDIQFSNDLNFAGEEVPLEMFNIRERYERELLSNCYFHSNTMALLKRSTRWFPVIEPILAEYGIPDDFKYLCVIESNLTNAVSSAGAVGFWQFLEKTGKEFGLKKNKDVDMRYNVELETVAACKYFLKAYERFHNWTIVAAAFNCGTSRIAKTMNEQNVNSYYDMLLPSETERYIFRILAVKSIFEKPEKYGIFVSENLCYKPFKYKTVTVDKTIDNLTEFAQTQNITYKLLKVFNPWLRSQSLHVKKGEKYEIKIPLKPFNITNEDLKQLRAHSVNNVGDGLNFDFESPDNE